MSIHPTAIVAASAVVPDSCTIGPYCTVGPDVVLGDDCELVSHVVLDGHLTAGARNRFFSFACVGVSPQDLKYKGEPTGVRMGDDNTIREAVTISRGTSGGGGTTYVGSHCLIMAYTHIGHDSVIGDGCILANGATLAGHVTVEDFAVVGALCPVHQYVRVGTHAYIGGGIEYWFAYVLALVVLLIRAGWRKLRARRAAAQPAAALNATQPRTPPDSSFLV